MTISEINILLGKLSEKRNRDAVLELSFALLDWMGITPNADNKPQLLSPQTQKLKEYLVPAPLTVQPQLYRLSADKQSMRIRLAVLKKLKKDYISQLVDNDPGLTSYQAFSKGLTLGDSAFIPSQPYFIHFVTTPEYDRLVLIFTQGDQKRILTFRKQLTQTQHNKILQQWAGIAARSKPEIADLLWKSLDIREVNKEFYQLIKGKFDDLVGIAQQQSPKTKEADIKQFAVRLIGRYIFCWFLKEKEIIPETLLSSKTILQFKDNYSHRFLVKLFFQTLNAEVTDKARYETVTELDDLYKNIPYLNGGLFEKHPEDVLFAKLHLNAWLAAFVKVLEQFDFTVDESSSRYQLVAIDPEMLGRIFENLLASQNEETEKLANQRKAFGAFYTPREIVDYMVNESLKAHLETRLLPPMPEQETEPVLAEPTVAYKGSLFQEVEPKQTVMNLSGKEKAALLEVEKKRDRIREKIEKLFTDGPDNPFDKEETTKVRKALSEVKVLDPACGSGAFPMGVMLRLMELRQVVGHGHKNNYELKNEILSKNIYGVDIMPMAVEIARLRAWLSLVLESDYKPADRKNNFGIAALPNLDFKFVCANSLIDSGYDEFLKKSELNQTLYRLVGEVQKLERIRDEYFDPKGDKHKKEVLQQEFEKTKKHIKEQISVGNLIKNYKLQDFFAKVDDWNPFDDSKPSSFFSPAWMFGISGGFDIVIGNPPYVDIKKLHPNIVRELFRTFRTTQKRINLYAVFVERGNSLLSSRGNLIYIIPNSILVNESYQLLRKLLIRDLKLIVKLPDNVFEAIVETIILQIEKGTKEREIKTRYFDNGEHANFNKVDYINFARDIWQRDEDVRFNIFTDDETDEVLKKIESTGRALTEIADFSLGITPYDKYKGHTDQDIKARIYHSATKKNSRYVPLISGKHIKKYVVLNQPIEEFLKYGDWLGAPREIRFFKEPRIIVRQIVSGKPDFKIHAGYTDEELYFTQIGFAVIAKSNDVNETKLILALINSNLLKFYHANRFLDKEKEIFQKILIANAKQFPIPKIFSKSISKDIIDRVDKIRPLKEQNKDTSTIEKEIDLLVYKLYELSYEEVKVVDPDFWLSEEEYEKYKF